MMVKAKQLVHGGTRPRRHGKSLLELHLSQLDILLFLLLVSFLHLLPLPGISGPDACGADCEESGRGAAARTKSDLSSAGRVLLAASLDDVAD